MKHQLSHIRAFIALADELHFNRAADRLSVTQSAFSRRIRELEESLGTTLVKRTTRRVALTDAGQAFLSQARPGIGHIDRAAALAQQAESGSAGELHIGYMSFAINGRLPDVIRQFRLEVPDVTLNLTYMSTPTQRQALMENKIDIGFLIGGVHHGLLSSMPFDYNRYVALLPKTNKLARKRRIRISDLAGEPFVLGTADHWGALRKPVFQMCHEAGFFPYIAQETTNTEGIFGLVAAGIGVSIFGDCARNIQRQGVVIKDLEDVDDLSPICATWDRRSESQVLRHFVEFLRKSDEH